MNLEKEQNKRKANKRKKTIKVTADIKDMKNRKIGKKSIKPRAGSFKTLTKFTNF